MRRALTVIAMTTAVALLAQPVVAEPIAPEPAPEASTTTTSEVPTTLPEAPSTTTTPSEETAPTPEGQIGAGGHAGDEAALDIEYPPPPPPEAPPGFTDGIPVGTDEIEEPLEGPTAGRMATSSTGNRYFGDGAWQAILDAAAATPKVCGISTNGLAGLIAAPVFNESSAATTPASAPSPMTLSRYDEWNGVYATTSNRSANYSLYENRNPNTPYKRAFWHPGVGIWQYDSAGLGAPFTAVEAMDVRIMAGDIARGMVQRYCNPAHSTSQARRQAAWQPWWAGRGSCAGCQTEFDNMMGTSPQFARIHRVPGISATGGAQQRTCTVGGSSVACWYVNPSVGTIQGATWWATMAPLDGGNPTVAPTPIAAPFYVVKRGNYEERHWLRADTGYAHDVSARRMLGQNARLRSGQPNSGLAWARSTTLCDQTTRRGQCGSTPPPGNPLPAPSSAIRSTQVSVTGTYDPVVFDRNGDGRADVLWHGRNGGPSSMWLGQGSARFSMPGATIRNEWHVVVPVDINGDGRDDLLFYNRTSGEAALWVWNSDGTFRSLRRTPGPGRQPLVGDFTGDGRQNVLWYGPGGLPGSYWGWDGHAISETPQTVQGHYTPLVGDFNGDGIDDIFWYGPGAARDSYWLHQRGGGFTARSRAVNGVYDPVVADVDGDGRDDIIWVSSTGTSSVWFEFIDRLANQHLTVTRNYTVVVADLEGDGRDDIIWYDPSGSGHLWSRWNAGRGRTSISYAAPAGLVPLAGTFAAGGHDGIFWYGPGSRPDAVWWR